MNDILLNFLDSTLKQIMSAINAECASLFLFDADNKELVLNSFYNSGNFNLKGLRKKIGEGICGKVADMRVPILVKDITTDSRFRRNGFNHYRTNSFVSIPLLTSKGILGLVNLADKSIDESFSEKDLEIAVIISKCASFAIDSLNNNGVEPQEGRGALDKQKSQLEKYASVGKLAAGVVHEINDPLDGIIRYANILLEQMEDSSPAREYLLEIKRGLSRITNITKSLLKFSHQINSDRIKKYVDAHKLIDESVDFVNNNRCNGNVHIYKKYNKNLPRILDMGLSCMFINLVKNAMDAMPKDSGRLEIYTDIKDSKVEISFKDTGLGIPLDVKGRIFDPFFTTKSMDKGTGLGLAICNEIINKYEGKIVVHSNPGEGSTFTISIPKKYLENA